MRRFASPRPLSVLLSLLASVIVTATTAVAIHAATSDGCPSGRIGLSIQWADSLVTYACSLNAVGDKTPAEVLGLVVRWSDGSVSTVDLPGQASSGETLDATTSASSSETSLSSSSSMSSSTSTSTVCVNGECTTTTSHSD